MGEIVTIERRVGDDWILPFQKTDSDGNAEDLTGYTYEGVVKSNTLSQEVIINGDDVSVLDQTKPDTMGWFVIKISREITKTIVFPSKPTSLNTQIRDADVIFDAIEYDRDDNRLTLGSIRIIARR